MEQNIEKWKKSFGEYPRKMVTPNSVLPSVVETLDGDYIIGGITNLYRTTGLIAVQSSTENLSVEKAAGSEFLMAISILLLMPFGLESEVIDYLFIFLPDITKNPFPLIIHFN